MSGIKRLINQTKTKGMRQITNAEDLMADRKGPGFQKAR